MPIEALLSSNNWKLHLASARNEADYVGVCEGWWLPSGCSSVVTPPVLHPTTLSTKFLFIKSAFAYIHEFKPSQIMDFSLWFYFFSPLHALLPVLISLWSTMVTL